MSIWEVLLIGAALAMDAVAVSMTNGMTEPRMRPVKALAIALTFAVFQFGIPAVIAAHGHRSEEHPSALQAHQT